MPFSESTAPTCTNCLEGQYTEKSQGTSCVNCAAGKWSNQAASNAKSNCGTCGLFFCFLFQKN